MERYDVGWLKKGTHEKHLSVLDYEKKVRSEEVSQLKTTIGTLTTKVQDTQKSTADLQTELDRLQHRERVIGGNVNKYDTEPEWQLPEPTVLMTANAYKTKIVEPFIKKLKGAIRSIVAQCLDLGSQVSDLRSRLSREINNNERLRGLIAEERQANTKLSKIAKDYSRICNVLGDENTASILIQAKAEEHAPKHRAYNKDYYRNR